MMLKQVFTTLAGAIRRCEFENAHTKLYRYALVRFKDDKPDKGDYDWTHATRYTWRLERTTRRKEDW